MALKCGLIGLPNVGKSTLFQALTRGKAEVANFPFCTIDPNQGAVIIADPRLETLSRMTAPQKTTPAALEVTDIAGLVRGASRGEGLGNQFLGHIREVDALCHVVRCFEDENIVHVPGAVDPVSDADVVRAELCLKDLDTVERRYEKIEKVHLHEKKAGMEFPVLQKVREHLEKGIPAKAVDLNDTEIAVLGDLHLLTFKPVLYVANIGENDLPGGGAHAESLARYAARQGEGVIAISARIENEVSELEDDAERREYLSSFGLEEAGKHRLIRALRELLGLISFFTTTGGKEVRAWNIPRGTRAPRAAGMIHSDFERGFISAEVIAFDQLQSAGGYASARERGLIRLEGKQYEIQDGDCCTFRWNV